MNPRIYVHEIVDIIGHHRADYFEHMTTGYTAAGKERRQVCFGIWGTLGITRRWPEVINLWEYRDLDHVRLRNEHETAGTAMQDPTLRAWWSKAQAYRSGGTDRILVPANYSPSIAEVTARGIVGWKVFYHEMVSVVPGEARNYLQLVGERWAPEAKQMGKELIGAYRTAMRNDSEVFLIWALRDWPAWRDVETQYIYGSDRVAKWRKEQRGIAIDWKNFLMCSAPKSPLQTGKQPWELD